MYIDYQEIGTTDLLFTSACSDVGSHEPLTLDGGQPPRAILYPSLLSDGELRLSIDADDLHADGLLLCRKHLIDTRGLPLDEIAISYRDQCYTWRKNRGVWSLCMPICKEFLSKFDISYQECTTSVALLGDQNMYSACYFAHDMRVLDVSLLFRLCHKADARIQRLLVCSIQNFSFFGIAYTPTICRRLSLSQMGCALHALCRIGILRVGHAYRVRDSQLDLIARGSGTVEYRLIKNEKNIET